MKKQSMRVISFLCCISYFVSYLMRLNYTACLVEIQRVFDISKSQAGLPITGSFLVYGVGQLLCGYLGDKIPPHKIIFGGLFGSALCNFFVVLFPKLDAMILIWCINGFFQSMLWPPIVRIMAETLDETWYRKCSVFVSFASSLGTIAIYMFAPLCFGMWGWQTTFLIPAIIGGITSFYWIYHTKTLKYKSVTINNRDNKKAKKFFSLFHIVPFLSILTAIILMGALRDGITTWMPAYMIDNFGMNTKSSVLITTFIPLFSIFSTLLASLLYNKLQDELITSVCLFIVSLVSCFILFFVHDSYVLGCLILMMLITGCMYGINLMLISHLPKYFTKFRMVSTISGLLNAFTYVGSSLSTYCFGAVAEKNSWLRVIGIWFVFSACGAIILFRSIKKWKAFSKESTDIVQEKVIDKAK